MAETETPSKTMLYLAVACGVLVLILVVVVIVTMSQGGDPTAAGGAAVAAAAAAAEATRRRNATRTTITDTKAEVKKDGEEIAKNKEDADTDMKAVPDEVAKLDDEALGNEADRLFGNDGNTPDESA